MEAKMISPAITTSMTTPISEALRIMTEKIIRRLPVVDDQNRLVGIVTFHDIDRAMRAPGVIALTPVEWVMSRNPVYIDRDKEMALAVTKMKKYKVSCLPVVEGEQVVGILSVSDIMDLCYDLLKEKEKEDAPPSNL
ncbi:CBS domain-containing protein [Heliorestis acidaminivorans]|uniref:CBS domain-containing protein n=1 Tax=Heliorestis acidaminivorans TaxID=553427 RepID=UPI0014784104|nr:CBS domain-containing protein [Heliorestis acidaminivorans]